MLVVTNKIETAPVALGIVWATKINAHAVPPGLDDHLHKLAKQRAAGLTDAEEHRRQQVRDMLRHGRYKPTGRGKPASEYLLRAAAQDERTFPRINGPVDVCNYISLRSLVPVSLWDLTLAGSDRYEFRLGREDERYVFNAGGQHIELHDLLVGCRITEAHTSEPIVNPVKDSLATKTTPQTNAVAACVYAPMEAVSVDELADLCANFAAWLARCGEAPETGAGVVLPGETCTV